MKLTCPMCLKEVEWKWTVSEIKQANLDQIIFFLTCNCGHKFTYPVYPKPFVGTDGEYKKIVQKAEKEKMFG